MLAFSSSALAVTFNCSFRESFYLSVGKFYTCDAIVNGTVFRSLKSVEGDHLPGKNNSHVASLIVYSQNLPFIPQDIGNFFPNLKLISWIDSNLEAISERDLQPFPNLIFLRIHRNQIVSVESDLFLHVPKLRYIDFSSNQIISIGENLIANLNDLETLNFNSNPCVSRMITDRADMLQFNEIFPVLCPPLKNNVASSKNPVNVEAMECPSACFVHSEANRGEVKQLTVIQCTNLIFY